MTGVPRLDDREAERGSVTLWLVGLCVVLLFLGGLSLDLWRMLSERRALAGVVDAAALAGSSGIDTQGYRDGDGLRLDPVLAEQRAWANIGAQAGSPGMVDIAFAVAADSAAITVVGEGTVEFTLLRVLLPRGAGSSARIEVTATSEPRGTPP